MKSFNQYLLEQRLSPDEALGILNLTSNNLNTVSLKKAYRTAAMRAHPDRGGTDEQMQKINAAYDMLKNAQSVDINKPDKDVYHDAKILSETYLNMVDPKVFNDYLSEVFGIELSVTKSDMKLGEHTAFRVFEIASKDRETVINARFAFYYANFTRKQSLGNSDMGEMIPGDVGTSYEILHNRKKMKLSQSAFDLSRSTAILTDPSVLFPSSKIKKKMKVGGGSSDSVEWMKPRDFRTTLTNKFSEGKMVKNDTYQMKFGKYTVQGTRMTFQRKGTWNFHLFPRDKNAELFPTLPESNKALDAIIELLEQLKRSSDPVNVWNMAARHWNIETNRRTLWP